MVPQLVPNTRSLAYLAALLLLANCSDANLETPSPATSNWRMLGANLASTFHNPTEQKISPANVQDLRQHWQFKPAAQANGTPAVVDGVVYATSNGGSYALDADSGQVLWQNRNLRATSSPAFHDGSLFIHGARGDLARIDAGTGEVLWTTRSDENPFTSGYSSPVVADRYVIVGVSSNEEGTAASDATFRGGVAAFDRDTGERLWRHYTAVTPYNGVGVWSTVTVDMETRRVFATSGNNYTELAGPSSDAIFALDLDTGDAVWTTQLTEGDVFTVLNARGPDVDFGTNPTLFEVESNGVTRRMLGAGQKSGVFWALDRDTGEVVWEMPLTSGSELIGGVLNNGAYDGERILVASNTFSGGESTLFALDPATGSVLWQRSLAAWVWAPITIANRVAFVATSMQMRAYDVENGDELFAFPTEGTITSGAAIAGGRVYFGSGMAYVVGAPTSRVYALSLPGDDPAPAPNPTPAPGPSDATFTSVYDEVFVGAGCAGGSCHGANAGRLSFTTQREAYDALVGVVARGEACGPLTTLGTSLLRVDPGNPDGSLLFDKVASTQPSCGDPMPISSALDPAQVDLIREWISAGALNN